MDNIFKMGFSNHSRIFAQGSLIIALQLISYEKESKNAKGKKMQKSVKMQKRVNQLKRTKRAKKCTCAPSISTLFLFIFCHIFIPWPLDSEAGNYIGN